MELFPRMTPCILNPKTEQRDKNQRHGDCDNERFHFVFPLRRCCFVCSHYTYIIGICTGQSLEKIKKNQKSPGRFLACFRMSLRRPSGWMSCYSPASKQPKRNAAIQNAKALAPSVNFGGSPNSTYGSTIAAPFAQHKQYKQDRLQIRVTTTVTYYHQQSNGKYYQACDLNPTR